MSDESLTTKPTVIRHTGWIATGGIFGLLLLLLGFVIAIQGSTRATNTLLHRGDCRARYQGQYDKDLALLLIEATKAQPDDHGLVKLATSANSDADHYAKCSNVSTSSRLPKVNPTELTAAVTTTTTRAP